MREPGTGLGELTLSGHVVMLPLQHEQQRQNPAQEKLQQDRGLHDGIPAARAHAKLQSVSHALNQNFSRVRTTDLESKGHRERTVKTSSSPSSASLWMVEDDVVEPKKTKNRCNKKCFQRG